MDKHTFNTIEEAESEINQFCKDNNNPIRLERRTVQQFNSKTFTITFINTVNYHDQVVEYV